MKQLSLTILRTLVTIVEVGSFNRAGELLGRSQPAISLQIKKLEEQVNRKLFTKVGQSYQINTEGKWLYAKAKKLLAINDDIFRELSNETLRGRMRLGIPSEFASALLPSIVGEFSQRYPDVSLDVTSALSTHLLSHNQSSQFDLILALMQPGAPLKATPFNHPLLNEASGLLDEHLLSKLPLNNDALRNHELNDNVLNKNMVINKALNNNSLNNNTQSVNQLTNDLTSTSEHAINEYSNIEIIREDDLVWVGDPKQSLPIGSLSLVLAPHGCVYRSRVIAMLKQQTQPWKITYTNPDFYGLMAAIKQGLGITALARSIVPEELEIIRDRRLPKLGRINICLINQDTQHPQVSQTMANYIKARIAY